jgi:four helix bundle protein
MAKHFKELVAWQRADPLRQAVWEIAARTPAMDFKFRDQWTDATRSICSNIAEGFGRRSHRDFARYLTHSCSSLREVEDLIHEAQRRGYLSSTEASELQTLVRRTAVPTGRLLRYLLDHPDPPTR